MSWGMLAMRTLAIRGREVPVEMVLSVFRVPTPWDQMSARVMETP